MNRTQLKKLILEQKEKIKKRKVNLDFLHLNFSESPNGSYTTKLKAKVKKKTIFITHENRCPETSVRNIFAKLTRKLNHRKYRESIRFMLNDKEVV